MSMSLPTPPRTAQKDKENLPPTPFTPSTSTCRTPRIVWSQENLHHAYSTQVRQLPSSSHSKGPHKSILKKPSLMPLMPQQPAREVTPEPTDPLQHPLYLNSPVSTLVASLQPGSDAKITLTDLTEAYSVLSARLKTKMHIMIEMCGPIPALEPLRDNSDELAEAFHRDLGRAFVNPQSNPPSREDSPLSSPSSVGSIKKRGYTEQEVKHARDLCNLCHAAMRCFSNIALAPVLSSIFSDSQLGDILTDVLAIPLSSSLPTPNARKTYQIAIWTLQIQRLPTAVLKPAADRIAYALRRGIDGELGREGKKGSASDGLKAVATLASNQPAVFLQPFSEVISSVFVHLTSQNIALRLQAAHAIISVSHALARVSSPPRDLIDSFRQATNNYLTGQQNLRKSPQDLSPLGKEFRVCFEADTPMHAAQSPMWALSVLAAFIVLSEGSALTHPKTIKLVLGHLRTAMGVKRTTVRATAGFVWRSLVWACVRLDASDQSQEHKDAGWKVVRQILDGAIGISIVAALVGQPERQDRSIALALEAVRTMIMKGGKACEEGVDVLERLLSAVGSGIEEPRQVVWSNNKLLVGPLFDGTLLHAEWKGLVPHVKDALNQCVAIQDVTPLQESEVIQHWDALFVIWKQAVERAPLGEDGEVPSPLLNAWQALLLTQAQLTQGFDHLTSTPAFIVHLTELLKSFLNDPALEWSLDAGAPSWASQPLKLGFVRNLWTVTRNVFAASTLAGAAQTLLCEVLRYPYLLGQDEVRDAWVAMCAELVLTGLPELVRELWGEHGQSAEVEVKRKLWKVVTKRWIDDAGTWNGAIELLRAPFALPVNWIFDQDDLELWVRLVDCALLAACARKVSTATVLDAIASEIGVGHNHVSLYAALPYLLSGVDAPAPGHQNLPQHPHVLLKLTNDVLEASYPPSDSGDKRMLLAVFESVKEIVGVTCKELLVELLACVQNGITVWITDEKEVFTDEEYNEQIIPFYVDSLKALRKLPPSIDILYKLCPFFTSAFNRIPEDALGPSAFKSFWTEMYTPIAALSTDVPEDLKPILRALQDVMCATEEDLGHGLSLGTQTQELGATDPALSIVPDSLEVDRAFVDGSGCNLDTTSTPSHLKPTRTFDLAIATEELPPPIRGSPADNGTSDFLDHPADPPHEGMSLNEQGPEPYEDSGHQTVSTSPLANNPDNIPSLGSTSACQIVPPSPDSDSSSLDPITNRQPTVHAQASLSSVPYHDPFIVEETKYSQISPDAEGQTSTAQAPSSPQPIKEEYQDIDPDTAMMLSSQDSPSSQPSKCSSSGFGKRRRSRILSQSSKRRKTAPGVGVEIINISDDEDSEQVALDLSIVVVPAKRRSLESRILSQQMSAPSTPKSEFQATGMSSSRKKRTFLEAVEVPTLQGLLKQRKSSLGSSTMSPSQRKTITRTSSTSQLRHMNSLASIEPLPGPSKRRRITDTSDKEKQKAEDWGDESPQRSMFFGSLSSLSSLEACNDDVDVHLTPERPSENSIPSSRPGQISASHIISPLPRRSRSEAYDPPSDDLTPSSPLKQVAARRIQRARTMPVVLTNSLGERSEIPARPTAKRMQSEEFLALEHAHVVVSSGASRMGLQELLEANQMVSKLSTVLGDEMTRKIAVDENQSD